MKDSDDNKRQGSGGFRFAGAGMAYTFKCAKCDQTRSVAGRVMLRKGFPALGWVCRECK